MTDERRLTTDERRLKTEDFRAHLEELRSQARALPEAPGVYFWKDARGRILYIGKAINLRARVSSYFSQARHDSRTRDLLSQARVIHCEVTATELDALFRESALIKTEQPKHNRMLKSPRRFYYLKLDGALEDPYLETAREIEDDESLYFGPFRSATVMRETLRFVHDVLPLRKCVAMHPRCRPCMYYQMHKCAAPFLDEEHRERHREAIARLFDLLDGRSDRVTAWLEQKRDRLSEQLLYERAAEVQQRLDALHELLRRQVILEAALQCRCVLVHQEGTARGEARLLLVARGKVIATRLVGGGQTEQILRWVQAHGVVMSALAHSEAELDAATVLERWLITNRERIRWVAIPREAAEEDLRERIGYVLGVPAES